MKLQHYSITLLSLLLFVSAFAQIQIDKQFQMTGSGSNAEITGIKSVANNGDVVSVDYIQRDSLRFAMASGSGNAYAVNLSPAVTNHYTVGMVIHFIANFANTGVTTLNVNSLGAKTIKKNYNIDLAASDIQNGQAVSVIYDGTNFQILSQLGNASVTSISAGTPGTNTSSSGLTFSASPLTSTGSIALANTAVTPGSYTSTNLTVDQQGRITAAASGSSGSSPHGMLVFTPGAISGTLPAGVTSITVEAWAGGGAGGGNGSGGGGAGGYLKQFISGLNQNTLSGTVGAAGSPTTFSVDGGTTMITCNNGIAGVSSIGGAGGTATTTIVGTYFSITGGIGSDAILYSDGTTELNGGGGGSAGAGGGGGGIARHGHVAHAGATPGGGGGSCGSSPCSGGVAGDGLVVVTY